MAGRVCACYWQPRGPPPASRRGPADALWEKGTCRRKHTGRWCAPIECSALGCTPCTTCRRAAKPHLTCRRRARPPRRRWRAPAWSCRCRAGPPAARPGKSGARAGGRRWSSHQSGARSSAAGRPVPQARGAPAAPSPGRNRRLPARARKRARAARPSPACNPVTHLWQLPAQRRELVGVPQVLHNLLQLRLGLVNALHVRKPAVMMELRTRGLRWLKSCAGGSRRPPCGGPRPARQAPRRGAPRRTAAGRPQGSRGHAPRGAAAHAPGPRMRVSTLTWCCSPAAA